MTNMNRRGLLASLMAGFGTAGGSAWSQAFPARPMRMLVGFAPGGGTDVLARLVSQKLSERVGQPVVVENRPGANSIVAAEATAKSAPDGYTLSMAATPNVTNPSLYSRMPFDTAKDFTWITQLTTSSLVLMVNNDVPVKSVSDLLALARKDPGKIAYGSSGAGGSIHLSGAMLAKMGNVDMTHVPYKGAAPAMTDLLAGRLTFMFGDIPQVAPFIKDGRVKALATSTSRRAPMLPDLPTVAESGLPGYDVSVWYGIFGPAGIPRPVVNRLAEEFRQVLAAPNVRDQLAAWGVQPVGSSPDEFDAFIRHETAKWAETIKAANIKLD